MKCLALALCLAFLLGGSASAGSESPSIHFNLDRHRILLPVSVCGSEPMDLILDTGMTFDGVFLFHEERIASIDTSGAIEVLVPGAGGGEATPGIMIESGKLRFGEVELEGQRVIIARGGHTQSFPTDGVIGASLFSHGIVQIDYERGRISLHGREWSPPGASWTQIPIELKKGIPWLDVVVEVVESELIPMRVYIDLASGDVLELLVGPGQKFTLPDSLERAYLGTGLSGDIHGHTGQSRSLTLGGYTMTNLPTAFAPAEIRSKQVGADGVLGNAFLERFHVVFDYEHGHLYIRPNVNR